MNYISSLIRNICFIFICLFSYISSTKACTAIIFGRKTTWDHSTYTGSTADCLDCDFRLAKVSSRIHSSHSTRPIFLYRPDYPHVIDANRASTWHPNNLQGTVKQRRLWASQIQPIGFIPQVKYTNALFETGVGYGLLNEHGVSIAESTCPAKFVSKPITQGGFALLDISALSRIGLERGNNAKDVIQIMGDLATKYGYYGAEWDLDTRYEEAGESLMVADTKETWVFHITPDDTGKSAVWVAQKVPDTDITVVANTFIIREIDVNDKQNFIYSDNIFQVAKRNQLWKPTEKLDFSKTFGIAHVPSRSSYSNIRIWRVFTLVNPDLIEKLDPHPNDYLDGYPFSVTPKKKLNRDDIFKIFRDHYEGSRFDLTKSEAAGPYGDPNRYDANVVGNMTLKRTKQGEFGRAISLFRTSYTSIIRSKGDLPPQVGSMMYYSQQQPSSSVFIPLYLSMKDIPKMFTTGSLFSYSQDSMFWIVTAISNWVHRYYIHAIGDIKSLQEKLEDYNIQDIDKKASELYANGKNEQAIELMQNFSNNIANQAFLEYTKAFPKFIAKFHDGYIRMDEYGDRINMKSMFYPEWWLRQVGYFSARETGGSYGVKYEPDIYLQREEKGISSSANWNDYHITATFGNMTIFVSGMLFGAIMMILLIIFMNGFKNRILNGYSPIN